MNINNAALLYLVIVFAAIGWIIAFMVAVGEWQTSQDMGALLAAKYTCAKLGYPHAAISVDYKRAMCSNLTDAVVVDIDNNYSIEHEVCDCLTGVSSFGSPCMC